MRISWAEKMVNEVNGSYEYYIDEIDYKMTVRVYLDNKKGIDDIALKKVKRIKPKNFEFIGIYWCFIERKMHLLFCQK